MNTTSTYYTRPYIRGRSRNRGHIEPADGLIQRIGNTPLFPLRSISAGLPKTVSLYAKAEYLNPGGSVKDRAALNMIKKGLADGRLASGKTLIDATSGNTGIAYAMIGSAMGIPVELAMPANATRERKGMLIALGAKLHLTDPKDGTDGSQQFVKNRVAEKPDQYFYPDQYNNDANWQAHFYGTGPEIMKQTEGRISHFVTGLGTSGTFTGVTRYLKSVSSTIISIEVQPESPLHGMEGLKHMATNIVPGIYDRRLADSARRVRTEDAIYMTKRLAREEGILVGVSAGANVWSALEVAKTIESGTVVTVLCDTGMRYLSESFWSNASSI